MLANNIWELLGKLFENVLFIPYNFFRLALKGWWTSNTMNWLIILIGFVMLFWWMAQMYQFKKDGKEDQA